MSKSTTGQRVYSSDRGVASAVRRVGPSGASKFERISWDAALDDASFAISDESQSSTARRRFYPKVATSATEWLNGLNVGDAFFNRPGASISERTFSTEP